MEIQDQESERCGGAQQQQFVFYDIFCLNCMMVPNFTDILAIASGHYHILVLIELVVGTGQGNYVFHGS